jgi:hypothetical protein
MISVPLQWKTMICRLLLRQKRLNLTKIKLPDFRCLK